MVAPISVTVRVALVTVLLTSAFAGSAAAQTQVNSFTQLPEVLKVGNVIYVEDDAGRRTKGRLLDLSGSSLTLESGRQHRAFSADSLIRVSRVDSKRNGFWTGFATGAVPGVLLGLAARGYCYNESPGGGCPSVISTIFWVGGTSGSIGGWIGATIDGLIDGETLIFAKSQASSATQVRLVPLLSKRGTGLAFSVRF